MIIDITPQFRDEDTHTSQTLTLDNTVIRLDTYTNKWDGCWYLDLYDIDGNPLVYGLRMTTGLDFLYRFQHAPGVPPGEMFINDHQGERQDPTLDSFRKKEMNLYYRTVAP